MDTSGIENVLGYRFGSSGLLARALTHSSWANENLAPAAAVDNGSNETLEFLGDSVLGLVIAEKLFEMFPSATEGQLTLMKHRLVSMETLAGVATRLDLASRIRMSIGLERTRGREKPSLLADTLEALIGAVFSDGGYGAARDVVARAFEDELAAASPETSADYKSMLQERLQGVKLQTPEYSVKEVSGPPHERHFRVEAVWQGGRAAGEGRSRKAAEMDAARKALESMADD